MFIWNSNFTGHPVFHLATLDAEPQGLCSTYRPRLDCSRRRHFLCEAGSSRTFFSWGPSVIKEGLCGLLSTASLFLLPSPSSLSPGLSTPCKHKERNCCSQAMCRSDPRGRPRSLTCLESQPGGWGRGSGRGAWGAGGGRSNPRLSPFSPVWKTPAPEEALPLEVGPTGSWGSGKLPSPAEFSLWETLGSPHGCSKPLPATLQTLAGPVLHFNRPGPISLILGWVILSSFH